MLTLRQSILDLYRRRGAARPAPVQFNLCPSLVEAFQARHGTARDYPEHFGFAIRRVGHPPATGVFEQARWFPNETFKPGTHFDAWGVGHEPGSAAAHHMTRMLHPLHGASARAELAAYPFPVWSPEPSPHLVAEVAAIHAAGLAAFANMACVIWEQAWYLRGMDRLVADFAEDPDFANDLLDRITASCVDRVVAYTRAGADLLEFGDDIGTQTRLMMSPTTYRRWIKPRLARVIAAAKAVNPEVIIHYHSCGHVTGLIPDLIEAGIDVLNPVQPESMEFAAIHRQFGAHLSFNGTLGTQTLLPFGSPEQVAAEVRRNLAIAGARGGLVVCPTHLLEPEVPWANIEAYVAACRSWQG